MSTKLNKSKIFSIFSYLFINFLLKLYSKIRRASCKKRHYFWCSSNRYLVLLILSELYGLCLYIKSEPFEFLETSNRMIVQLHIRPFKIPYRLLFFSAQGFKEAFVTKHLFFLISYSFKMKKRVFKCFLKISKAF